MITALSIVLGIGVIVVVIAFHWRETSRRTSLPCPSWLAWMVELDNPLAKSNNGRTFDKMNSSYLSIACALVLCVGDRAFPQETRSAQKKLSDERVQTLVQESRRAIGSTLKKEIYLPAIAVALVDHDDVLWTEAFGYRDAVRNELWSV